MSSANAYEAYAHEFLAARDRSMVGADIVSAWAKSLPAGTDVIEIACGGGYPVSRALLEAGVNLWAIDASPALLEKFRSRFPSIPTQCAPALECDYFGRKFGAAVSIGLIFLLEESEQVALLHRFSEILLPNGRLLFTAPIETCSWRDITTGHDCRSLGHARYIQILQEAGFRLVGTRVDKGKNNHYEAQKVGAG
ncbi:MAG TPA: class I SAM-dependent methyltransferase [Steroidobacter sp.]|uniref:class I SAM-dependent methyltransferase n=1 Tax=Steroidobacter sp. TaxID=1978227 RepID=UPI002EDAF47A